MDVVMKLLLPLSATALLALGGMALAQTAAPNGAGQNLTPEQQATRDRIQGERQTCRTEAQGKGIQGEALRAAVMSCMAKVDPMGAKRMGCAQAAQAKGLTGMDMQKSMRACMTGAG